MIHAPLDEQSLKYQPYSEHRLGENGLNFLPMEQGYIDGITVDHQIMVEFCVNLEWIPKPEIRAMVTTKSATLNYNDMQDGVNMVEKARNMK